MHNRILIASAAVLIAAGAYIAGRSSGGVESTAAGTVDEHAGHGNDSAIAPSPAQARAQQSTAIPAGAGTVAARLAASPRHGEWAKIPLSGADSVMAWVVYPERRDNAAVVIAIHENTGLTTWARGVADQLAADGFIGIAPDLLSVVRGGASSDTLPADQGRALIGQVTPDKMNAMVEAVAKYGMNLPSARKAYGVIGFCWGGSASFNHAVHNATGLKAAVVYYGSAPAGERMRSIAVPVLGLYGGSDQRINAGIPAADSTMKSQSKRYEYEIFDGAGHGFLRGQDNNAANAEAARKAWPRTVAFLKQNIGT